MFSRINSLVMSGILIAAVIFTLNAQDTTAAKADTVKSEDKKEESSKKKSKDPEFQEVIKDFEKIEGLFTFYRDKNEGKVYMEIKPSQFETDYLCNITRQSGDGYLFDSGAMLGSFPFFFKRIGKQVQLIARNVKFRASPDAAIKRAVDSNFSHSLIGSAKIASQPHPERGSILVEPDGFFLQDVNNVGYITGQLKLNYSYDEKNSWFSQLKSFPLNTEIEVTLHFKSSKPTPLFTLADSRSMFHVYHYSLSALPKTDYQPRVADDRIGHFLTMYQDYSSLITESPYTRYITRWHLVKSEPNYKISKPRQPIVFWIENTVPAEYRDAIREGILAWNPAFIAVGFKEAIEVRQMPDDADWDPADVRYNTVRWIVQPGAAYAVGPSRANPFTGQIYDADIRISADFVRAYFREFDEFVTPLSWKEAGSLNIWPEENQTVSSPAENLFHCNFSTGMARQMAFGWNLLLIRGRVEDRPEDLQKFIHDGLVDLVLHEVGHTLGLRHNFKASSVNSLQQLTDKNYTQKAGISGSVMDYNALNLAPDGEPQGAYFQTRPGPYDYWAIEYAYKPLDPGAKISETEMLEKIASRVAEPQLQYGTDEDAFGLSTRGMDPTISLWDLGSNPIQYYRNRTGMAREVWHSIPDNFGNDGGRYQKFRMVFSNALGEYTLSGMNASKYIGGLYMHRDHIGDPDGRPPFKVVPAELQRQALNFLIKTIFAKDAFQFSPELLNRLAAERFWDFEGTVFRMLRIDYPIHGIVQLVQAVPMFRLYNYLVLQRLQDNEIRFAEGEEPFTMAEMFDKIRRAVWEEAESGENINSFRRELQRMHLHVLTEILVKSPAVLPHDAVTLARADLLAIKEAIGKHLSGSGSDIYTRAHLQETTARIEAALTARAEKNL